MPYNILGDLYKAEVASKLRDIGHDVKDVHALNLIMEEMWLLIHSGDRWLTTDDGMQYQQGKWPAFDAPAWHPSLVDAVAEYLD